MVQMEMMVEMVTHESQILIRQVLFREQALKQVREKLLHHRAF